LILFSFATMAIPREKLAAAPLTARGWFPATIEVAKFRVAMAVAEGEVGIRNTHRSYEITTGTTFVFAVLR
jgi:hypothetical protein